MPKLILGARNREELEPLVGDFQKLGLEVLAATDDGSLGHHGLVTDVLRKLNLGSDFEVYTCGPRPMMSAIHHYCQKRVWLVRSRWKRLWPAGWGHVWVAPYL